MLTKVAKRAFSTVKFNFTGKVAIVTGASSGIGKAVAKGFGASGAKVVCADFDEKLGKETCEEIKKAGGDAIFVKTDVSKFEDNQKLVKVRRPCVQVRADVRAERTFRARINLPVPVRTTALPSAHPVHVFQYVYNKVNYVHARLGGSGA